MTYSLHTRMYLPVFISLVLLWSVFLSIATPQVFAENLKSDSYLIQFGNFNITAGRKTSASYDLTDTVGQSIAGPFGAYGSSSYFVGAGFQYIYQIGAFEFIISDLDIPLGILTPGVHSSDTNTLTISTRGAGGFIVYAYQTHPLRLVDDIIEIDNTTCDAGTCTTSNAEVWTNQSVPGFGFNVDGATAESDFVNTTYFRPFANAEAAESMQPVMSSPNIAKNESATVTYKAGIPGTQAAGDYETSVVYVAVPGY